MNLKDTRKTGTSRRGFLSHLVSGALSVLAVGGAGLWLVLGNKNRAMACLRPPGALPEADFLATCIRCGRCADACPNRAIFLFSEEAGRDLAVTPGPGQRGTPVIFARRKACILCSGVPGNDLLCTAACPSGALQRTGRSLQAIRSRVKMGTAEIDKTLCYSYNGASCGACVRACPFEGRALRAGQWEKPILDLQWCVGCGLCERSCLRYPQAIHVRPRGG